MQVQNKYYWSRLYLGNTCIWEVNKALLDMVFGANIYFDYRLISQYRNLKIKSKNSSKSKKWKIKICICSIKSNFLLYHRYKRRIHLKELKKRNFRGIIILFKYSKAMWQKKWTIQLQRQNNEPCCKTKQNLLILQAIQSVVDALRMLNFLLLEMWNRAFI